MSHYTSQTQDSYKNIFWKSNNLHCKTDKSLCILKETQFVAKRTAAEWSPLSTFLLSYLVKIASAAVAVCMVSHPYAGHLCLKEEQIEKETRVNINKASSIYSSNYV